eukprot:m.308040 g.308040  ORF g.308040 m.308040 type:complete len:184 (+) comp43301_c0_seq1:64-615(+)
MDTSQKKKILDSVQSLITAYSDFPKAGIKFRDIFPIFQDASVFQSLIDLMVEELRKLCSGKKIDAVLGLEARGFLFAPIIALKMGVAFVPVRKKGKLPGDVKTFIYEKEYGKDQFEIQSGSLKKGQNVIVVDDLVATGGSLAAVCSLVKQADCNVLQCMVLIELSDLNGKKAVDAPVEALLSY